MEAADQYGSELFSWEENAHKQWFTIWSKFLDDLRRWHIKPKITVSLHHRYSEEESSFWFAVVFISSNGDMCLEIDDL